MTSSFHRIDLTEKNKNIFTIGWGLTNVCNYLCSYCWPEAHSGSNPGLSEDLGLLLIQDLQQTLNGRKKIAWTLAGGEVTRHPGFDSFLQQFHRNGDFVLMTSNGSKPLEWWEKNLHKIYFLELSYHQEFTPLTHFLELSKMLNSSDVHGHIHMMAPPGSVQEIISIAKKLSGLSGISVGIDMIYDSTPQGSQPRVYSADERKMIAEFSHPLTEKLDRRFDPGKILVTHGDGRVSEELTYEISSRHENKFKGWNCHAGLDGVYINTNGSIVPARCGIENFKWSAQQFRENFEKLQPIQCPFEYCQCGPDIMLSKQRSYVEL
jgi:MoaA/NifB/PqqE/SkfB family radical SAM enzyme